MEYVLDLESDFSAIHGIRDPYEELSGPQYFQMAARMVAYKGVMRMRVEAEAEKTRPKSREELESLAKSGRASQEEQKALYYAKRLGAQGIQKR
ncbi:hypothetical protein [Streptomyces sp. LARHCF252]